MARSIALTKASGVISVAVNGQPPRSLAKQSNITVKPIASGAVVKTADETWRLQVLLEDTVTKDAVQSSPYANVTALVNDLSAYFG